LQQATARQLDGGKAGCFLSGGTDSSTVAGMIGLAHGTPAATYSIGFEAEGYDEMEFAHIAVRQFNTEHHEYYVTPDDLVRSIPMVAASYDQPFGNSSALPAYYCAKMAKDDGVTRILAGDGGDELFGGNSRYAKQRVFDWYQHIPGAIRTGIMEPLLGTSLASSLPLVRKASSYVEQASVPMPDRLQMYNLITRLGIEQALGKDFLAQLIFLPRCNTSAKCGRLRKPPTTLTANLPSTGATPWPKVICPKSVARPAWPASMLAFPCSTMTCLPSRCACRSTTNSRA
jgi:asparagine synthase (glutamine-hydrolysing)